MRRFSAFDRLVAVVGEITLRAKRADYLAVPHGELQRFDRSAFRTQVAISRCFPSQVAVKSYTLDRR
jgi:hypothetical protein